jgi:Origin recognition complex (ORC) subunit 5 C-terminus
MPSKNKPVRPRDWYVHIPLSQKYLVVAAFLASYNPKETDEFTFAGKKRAKRRKLRAGEDEDHTADGAPKGGNAGSGLRVFSLDRLFGIFAQLASTGGVEKLWGGARAASTMGMGAALCDTGEFTARQIAVQYGDADLFAAVSFISSLIFLCF